MALPVQSYVWPRVRHVVARWVARVTALPEASILWSDQNAPSPGLPYIGLTRRTWQVDGFDEEVITEVPIASTLTCTASGAGETIAVILYGTRYAYTLTGGDTTEDGRDALLALIASDLIHTVIAPSGSNTFGVGFQPCTAVASGTDAIDFAGLGYGALSLAAIEGATVSETRAYRSLSRGLRRALVRIELFWPEQSTPFETADAYAGAIVDALLETEQATWLASRGVGVEQAGRVRVQDFSGVAGGALRETRLSIEVLFNAMAKRYQPGDGVEEVEAPTIGIVPPTEV